MTKKGIYILIASLIILFVAVAMFFRGPISLFRTVGKGSPEYITTTLNVENYVPAQEPVLRGAVTKIPGIATCSVIATANKVIIKYNPKIVSENLIAEALSKAGFQAKRASKKGALKIVDYQIQYIP